MSLNVHPNKDLSAQRGAKAVQRRMIVLGYSTTTGNWQQQTGQFSLLIFQ